MLKLTILSLLFAIALCEVDIEQFYGKWLPVTTYPDSVIFPYCHWRELSRVTNKQCQCGDFNNVPLVQIKTVDVEDATSFPVLVVDSADKVASTLQLECKCDGKPEQHLVFRKISDNYFVEYEIQTSLTYTPQEPNTANLMVKKIPKLSELEAAIKSEDLGSRKGGFMCTSDTFVSETS